MTTLVLNKLWLNRMDTGEAISGASGRDRSSTYAMEGSVDTYASGRRRAITTLGLHGQVQRRMVAVDMATKNLLVTWLGLSVQMRDHRGQKWFGTFFQVDVTEYMRPDLYTVTITLDLVTLTEGV